MRLLSSSEALPRMNAALAPRGVLSPADVRGWSFVDMNGAVVMVRANEAHIAAPEDRRGRWFNRSDFVTLFAPILDVYGHAVTFVRKDDETCSDFVRRLGFELSGDAGTHDRYILRAIKYAPH